MIISELGLTHLRQSQRFIVVLVLVTILMRIQFSVDVIIVKRNSRSNILQAFSIGLARTLRHSSQTTLIRQLSNRLGEGWRANVDIIVIIKFIK